VDARAALQPVVWLSSWEWLGPATAGAALAGLLGYLGLAGSAPGLALLVATVSWLAAMLGLVLLVSPAERKITFERQLEVVGARVVAAVLIYFGVGFLALYGLNALAPEQARVPIAWGGPLLQPWENPFFRRVTFWPFYALVLLGCQNLVPTPPGAC
jgi:hypothetical protein